MKRESLHVLVLEPNLLQCDLIKLALTRNSMNPIICHESATLRRQLLDHRPDVLLIDTYLPGQNGLDLISQLRLDGLLGRTKVFFLSSMGFSEIVQKAARLGVSGFLVKPLNTDLMVSRILQSFDRQGQLSM